jgi:membrane protein DedA with SNARE-associated domain
VSSIGDWSFGGLSVNDILDFIEAHKAWAGPLLGVTAFGESLFLVGAFMPATGLMVATGALIEAGTLDAGSVVFYLVLGSVIGDAVTYWLGRAVGPSLVHRPWFNRHRKGVAWARLFFRKYGFRTIFIGRFLGPLRHTTPLVAGMMRMDHLNFQIANLTSAIAWVPVMLAVGYLLAKFFNLRDLSGLGVLEITAAVLLLTVFLTGIVVVLQRRQGKPRKERSPPVPAE